MTRPSRAQAHSTPPPAGAANRDPYGAPVHCRRCAHRGNAGEHGNQEFSAYAVRTDPAPTYVLPFLTRVTST